jgi:hypothetical protein
MLFLIESDSYSAHIAAHGFKREDFAPKFREEALRALSGMCPRVFTGVEEHEVVFSSSWLIERQDLLEQMMLNGNDEFLFKYGNSGSYRLKVQEYKL